MMGKLFPEIPFVSDETPMSWAARMAAFHTRYGVVPFLNDLGVPALDLARGMTDAILRLCDKADADPAPVLQNAISAVGNRKLQLRDVEFSSEFTTGVVTRLCVECLEEDWAGQRFPHAAIRHRLVWRLASVRTCPLHLRPLDDVRTDKWDGALHELQSLQGAIFKVGRPRQSECQRTVSPLQAYVLGRIEGHPGPQWLDNQGVEQAVRATEMLGALVQLGPRQRASDMTQDMWDAAGREGWSFVSAGEHAITEMLTNLIKDGLDADRDVGPRLAFGMLYNWLSASRLAKDPGPIRDILRDILVDRLPLAPGQSVLGKPIEQPRISTLNSIAKAKGIHPRTLHNVLQAAGVVKDELAVPTGPHSVVEYWKAKVLIDTARHAVAVTNVPNLLNASRPLVAALIELGLLSRIQDHDRLLSKVGKAVDGRDLRNILLLLQDMSELVDQAPDGFVALSKAAELSRVSLKNILELLFAGFLSLVFRWKGDVGFAAIRVNPDEVKNLLISSPPGLSLDLQFSML